MTELKINICALIMSLVLLSSSIHVSKHSIDKRYSQDQYISALAAKQDNFKKQMLDINKEIQQIDKIIDYDNATVGYKLFKLEQAMADERDSLYKVENDLVLPFTVQRCQCVELTDQKIQQIQVKVSSVKTHIQNLQKTVNECSQCPNLKEIQQQIKQQKQYLRIVQETLNAECCWAPKKMPQQKPIGLVNLQDLFFKNNLTAKNWFYGSTNEEKYRYKTFMRSTQYNLTSCPGENPFVRDNQNICFNCSSGAYNIGDEKCISCSVGFYFNYAAERCDFCGQNLIYNGTLQKCAPCAEGLKFDNSTETGCVIANQKTAAT